MDTYLVSLLLAFLTSVALTPAVLQVARRRGLVDAAGASHRKVHVTDIPRLGGVAIVASFYAPIVGLMFYETKVGTSLLGTPELLWGLLGGGLVIALLGLYDDLKGASPKLKLLVQVGVALWVTSMGFRIDRVDLPFLAMFDLGLLSWPVTVLWIVGVTNAVNLIDGLDGLAAGIALFGIAPMAILALYKGNVVLALICCSLSGAVLGFLVYNFHPARIFMGDTGSMFLGFVLAVVTVYTSQKGRVAVAMLTPILALGLPLLDTLLAMTRRAWFGQSIFVGDKQHIHHRLLDSGLSHRRTVLVMYGFAALFASLGLAVSINRDFTSGMVLGLSVMVASLLLRKIGYLTLPTSMGGEVQIAAALRDRNRLILKAVGALEERVQQARRLEDVAVLAGELAGSVGASWATLELAGLDPSQPVRSWSWEPGPRAEEARVESIPVHNGGIALGTLTLGWNDPRAFHEALIPAVERGCSRLAERLAPLPPAPRPSPTADPAPQRI